MDNLDFVNSIDDNINYREDQKDLIQKAMEISNGDPLNALQYIVTCMNHEEYDIEFKLVFTIPANEEVTITLPIIETEPKDELGYYVNWNGKITHNINVHTYKKKYKIKDYHVRFFGLGISGFGMHSQEGDNEGYKKYLTKVISFGRLGHTFTSLENAFNKCQNNFAVPHVLPSNITNTSSMFSWCKAFNQSLITWNTSNVSNVYNMFIGCSNFNQPLEWDTSNVTNMSSMFYGCTNFNQPLKWNTSNVTDMSRMFCCCTNFNQPLELNTSNVTNMCHMFAYCTNFNQPLQWDTSNVTNMRSMFYWCTNLNQPLEWNTSNVTDMCCMFYTCTNLNQPLIAWNTSNAIHMDNMFFGCTRFNQPLTAWNTSNVTNIRGMFNSCNISEENKPHFNQ